jgi:hypothetical protein
MTIAADRECTGEQFCVEVISTGMYASGFGEVGDGRSFAFHITRHELLVEVYRPRLNEQMPQAEDVVAIAARSLKNIDVSDERSVAAAVRDAVAEAQPVVRSSR